MSGSVQINGIRCTHLTMTIPMYGTWVADVDVATSDVITSSVVIAIDGGLSMLGTVHRQSLFAGKQRLRVVGGANGWRKSIPARGYSQPSGVLSSAVISDAARECGESVNIPMSTSLGAFYTRRQGKAKHVLSILASNVWYVDAAGVTQIAERVASAIVSPFTVESWDGSRGVFVIATETYQDWIPGRTFATTTVTTPQTISSVTIDADNDGKVRLTVLTADSYRERLLSDVRSIIRDEFFALHYAGTYEYVIASSPLSPGLVFTVDANPTDPRMPPLTRVPLATGVGRMTAPTAGTKCRIRFVNASPSRPEVVSLDGQTETVMTTEATALLIYNTLAALMVAAGGGPLLAAVLSPLLGAAVTSALAAQGAPAPPGVLAQTIAATAAQAGFATGVPSPAMFAAWTAAIATASNKVPDVTGSFPGVGIPNG